jgi:hypothetical protein
MDASVMNKAEASVAHLMLHRNINLGSTAGQRSPRVGLSAHLLTIWSSSVTLLELHRIIAAGCSGPADRGRTS